MPMSLANSAPVDCPPPVATNSAINYNLGTDARHGSRGMGEKQEKNTLPTIGVLTNTYKGKDKEVEWGNIGVLETQTNDMLEQD